MIEQTLSRSEEDGELVDNTLESIHQETKIKQMTKEGEIDEEMPDDPSILHDTTDEYLKKLINEMTVNQEYARQVDKLNKSTKF